PVDRNSSGWALSASGQANFNLGPLGANAELGAGRNYNNESSNMYGGLSGSGAVNGRKGLNASASIGGQISYYSARQDYYENSGTCRA
ncbi:MAG: hypothetical protein ACREQV_01805, partial [Candidatus Binatia bacterium]